MFLFFNVIFYVVLDFSNLHLFQRTGFHLCVAADCLTLPAVNAPVCRTKNSKRIIIQPRRIPQPLNCRNTTGYTIGSHYIIYGQEKTEIKNPYKIPRQKSSLLSFQGLFQSKPYSVSCKYYIIINMYNIIKVCINTYIFWTTFMSSLQFKQNSYLF